MLFFRHMKSELLKKPKVAEIPCPKAPATQTERNHRPFKEQNLGKKVSQSQ